MKNKPFITIFLSILLSNLSFADSDSIMAVVGNKSITRYELQNFEGSMKILDPKFRKKGDYLNILIEVILLNQLANQYRLDVTKSEVEASLNSIANSRGENLNDIFTKVSNAGIAKEDFLNIIKLELTKEKLLFALLPNTISVSNEEVQDFVSKNGAKENLFVYHEFSVKEDSPAAYKKLQKYRKILQPCNVKHKQNSNIMHGITEEYISYIPPFERGILNNSRIGDKTPIFNIDEKFKFFVLCEKRLDALGPEENRYLKNVIIQQKFSNKMEDYIDQLKKNTEVWINQNENSTTVNK